jgi:hypothetical protein
MERGPGEMLEAALAACDRDRCPGVPVRVLDGEAPRDEERVEWLAARMRLGAPA